MKSMLFTPANKPEWAEKAWKYNPDAVILDLEDSIAESRKEEARETARNILASLKSNWYVRVNSRKSALMEEDIEAVLHENIRGIILPKIQSKDDIVYVQNILKSFKEKNNFLVSRIKLIPTIEDAKGMGNLREIAGSSSMISAIGFGGGDFSLDIGVEWDPSSIMIRTLMAQLVIESRIAGLEPPHDSVYPNYRDIEGLRNICTQSRKMGFGTKHAIHPEQVSIINEIFSPTEKEIEKARKIKEEFEKQESLGNASLGMEGTMIDYPVYRNALRVLEEASEHD